MDECVPDKTTTQHRCSPRQNSLSPRPLSPQIKMKQTVFKLNDYVPLIVKWRQSPFALLAQPQSVLWGDDYRFIKLNFEYHSTKQSLMMCHGTELYLKSQNNETPTSWNLKFYWFAWHKISPEFLTGNSQLAARWEEEWRWLGSTPAQTGVMVSMSRPAADF